MVKQTTKVAGGLVLFMLLAGIAGWLWLRAARPHAPTKAPAAPVATRSAPVEPVRPGAPVHLPSARLKVDESNAGDRGFTGKVLSAASAQPVAGASLTFLHDGAAVSADSDKAGLFSVKAGAGLYELVSASASGYLPMQTQFGHSPLVVAVRPGFVVEDVTVYLSPSDPLTVVVQDKAGKRIAGAEVRVFAQEQGAAEASPTITGANGEATVATDSTSVVEARHAGYVRAQVYIDQLARVTRRLVITLQAGAEPARGSITGRVVNAAGAPVDGALVEVWQPPSSDFRVVPPGAQTLTTFEGRFALKDLVAGAYRFRASAEGQGSVYLERVSTNGAPLDVHLGRAEAGIRGVVKSAGGKPITAFTVAAAPREGVLGGGPELRKSVVDPRGEYELSLPPGRYEVSAAGRGSARSPDREVEIGDGTVTVDFVLDKGHKLFGRVVERSDGTPIVNADVTLESNTLADGISMVDEVKSDSDGGFSFEGLAAGRTSINVQALGHNGRILGALAVPTTGDLGPITVDLQRVEPGEEPKTEFFGIGAVIAPTPQGLDIKECNPAGGAASAGLQGGDLILAIDGQDVGALGYDNSIQLIRGPEGTVVTLTVKRRDGSTALVPVTRKRITY